MTPPKTTRQLRVSRRRALGRPIRALVFVALAFPLPPQMPFGALVGEVLPQFYGPHPQFKEIDWAQVRWTLNNEDFTPDLEKSLDDNGITHKSLLRFWTPGLDGHQGSAS